MSFCKFKIAVKKLFKQKKLFLKARALQIQPKFSSHHRQLQYIRKLTLMEE